MTSSFFELKTNPHLEAARPFVQGWFRRMLPDDEKSYRRYMHDSDLDMVVANGFPDANEEHFKTVWMLFLWVHISDDIYDDASSTSSNDLLRHKEQVQATLSVFRGVNITTRDPFVLMFRDVLHRFQQTATAGNCVRLMHAYESYSNATIVQRRLQASGKLAGVEEYVLLRRDAGFCAAVQAVVEFSLNISLPDSVFEDRIVRELLCAGADLMVWPNDLYSFNKEYAIGDNQNFVSVVMAERGCGLQNAIDEVTNRLSKRIEEYLELKTELPSFGFEVDQELSRYLKGCEQFHQGVVEWYSRSRRFVVKGCEPTVHAESGRILVKLAPGPGIEAN